MKFTCVLGVDISKDWFNVCLMNNDFEVLLEQKVVNRTDEIFLFIADMLRQQSIPSIDSVFLCMEHTGIYVQNLVRSWMAKGGQLAVVPANQIRQRMAGSAGWAEKSDFLDSRRIAEYCIRFSDKLKCYRLQSHSLDMIQRLQRQRARLLNVLHQLQVPVKESVEFDSVTIVDQIMQNQAGSIAAINKDLKAIERLIQSHIEQDPYMKRIFKLIQSVTEVGPVTATEVIITTEAFTKFSPDQAKGFSRYSGVIPLEHTSGTSIKKKSRTTKSANRHMKKFLTMGALSAIKVPGELRDYYQRKILEGKHHFTVINAIRNKIILRIFAAVRNDIMYSKEFQYLQ